MTVFNIASRVPVTTATLLAHQGGWDEILLVAAPIIVIVGALWVAKRRVDSAAHTASTPVSSDPPAQPDAGHD